MMMWVEQWSVQTCCWCCNSVANIRVDEAGTVWWRQHTHTFNDHFPGEPGLAGCPPLIFTHHYSKGRCRGIRPQRILLRHDKQQWMEQAASTGENHVLCGEIKDAFASFRRLKQKCAVLSAPLKALDEKLLSDRASVAAKWQEHFRILLNRPTQSPPDTLVSEASTPDSTIDIWYLPSCDHWGLQSQEQDQVSK